MKIRGIAAIAGLALAVTSLAACGGGTDNGGGGDASGTGDGASTEGVNLTFQSLSDQPAAIAAVKGIVDTWNADHPDIQVEIVPAGWDGIYDKLITQFNGGSAPDIIHYEAASIIPFAADGYLADLTDLIDPDLQSDVSQGIWDSVTVDGQVIAVPTELQSYMVFANKGLLDAAGVEVPTGDTMTWDQFREIAQATTTKGVYGVGWGLKSPTATMMSLALGFDGGYFDGTGLDVTIDVGDDELAVPVAIHQMAYDDQSILPVTLTQSGSEVLASFYAGQVAMTVQGSFQAANMAVDAPADLDWVVLPPLEGSAGATQSANPQTLSVNIDSANVEAAAQFVNFFASTDNLVALNRADALIPPSTSAQEAMAAELGSENGWDMILGSGKVLESAPFLFVNNYTQWKDTVATPAFQRYLANEIDETELQAQLTDGWDQIGG